MSSKMNATSDSEETNFVGFHPSLFLLSIFGQILLCRQRIQLIYSFKLLKTRFGIKRSRKIYAVQF